MVSVIVPHPSSHLLEVFSPQVNIRSRAPQTRIRAFKDMSKEEVAPGNIGVCGNRFKLLRIIQGNFTGKIIITN